MIMMTTMIKMFTTKMISITGKIDNENDNAANDDDNDDNYNRRHFSSLANET